MITVIRIAKNHKGKFEGWNLTEGMDTDEILSVIGLMDVIKNNLISSVGIEDIETEEADSIRDLLDGKA